MKRNFFWAGVSLLAFCFSALGAEPSAADADRLSSIMLSSSGEKERAAAFYELKMLPATSTLRQWQKILEKSDSIEYKVEAIQRISTASDRKSVNQIVAMLDNQYSEVRQAAILTLKNIGDDRVYPKIIMMAQSENPVFRFYAAEALSEVYDKRFDQLITEMMKDSNKSVRIQIIRLIQKNRLDKMINLVRGAAQKDDNYEVTVEALKTLAAFNDEGSIQYFIKSLSNSNYEIRRAAAENIIQFNVSRSSAAVSDQLEGENDPVLKNMLVDMLVRFKNAGGYRGLEKILIADKSPALRIRAAYALGVVKGERASEILVKALSDADYRVRSEACFSLSLIGSKSGVSKMLALVSGDPDIYVRTAALYSLEKIRDKDSIIPLYDLFTEEKDPVFRKIMRHSLRNMIEKSL